MAIAAGTASLSLISTRYPLCFRSPFLSRNPNSILTKAKKTNDNLPSDSQAPPFNLKLSSSSKLIVQSAIALTAFGFVDAGYSGDWSRIGAISKDTEEFLKIASVIVVPFSLLLIFAISSSDKTKDM